MSLKTILVGCLFAAAASASLSEPLPVPPGVDITNPQNAAVFSQKCSQGCVILDEQDIQDLRKAVLELAKEIAKKST